MKILHLGAGSRPHVGEPGDTVIANDVAPLPGIDVHDLTQRPWPYRGGAFDVVIANDILEHLPDFFGAMEEIHDALVPGGRVLIQGPYAGSRNHLTDPTHHRGFTELTWMYMDRRHEFATVFAHYTYARFRLDRLSFETPAGMVEVDSIHHLPESYLADVAAHRVGGNMLAALVHEPADERVRTMRERQHQERTARFEADVETIVRRLLKRERREHG